jgi:sec-independent protein translocase protein TatA
VGLGLENPVHLLIIAVVVLLVLGPKRLPEAGRALGKGIRQFKDGISGDEDEKPPKVTAASEPPAEPRPEPTKPA